MGYGQEQQASVIAVEFHLRAIDDDVMDVGVGDFPYYLMRVACGKPVVDYWLMFSRAFHGQEGFCIARADGIQNSILTNSRMASVQMATISIISSKGADSS